MIENNMLIQSKFKDIRVLGNGSKQYRTYKAREITTDRMVVLKTIDYARVILYKSLINKKCDNVCRIYDVIELVEDETSYYVVVEEYINGIDLYDYVVENGVLSEKEAIFFGEQLCDGLAFLHKNKIIHKDLSYGNILIDSTHELKIIDFGSSRMEDKSKKVETSFTMTFGFTAPEINSLHTVDRRADIFSLGRVIRFMLTGDTSVPYNGNKKLQKIISKCEQIDKKERYKKAHQVKKALNRAIGRKRYITVFRSNVKIAIAIICALIISFICFVEIYYIPEADNTQYNQELSRYADMWTNIDRSMNLTGDYDLAIDSIKALIDEDACSENVYVNYAKCFVGKGDYDRASEELIHYIRDILKYENLLSYNRECYIYLLSLENRVSDEQRESIADLKKQVSEYVETWNKATKSFQNENYDKSIAYVNQLIDKGTKMDIAYFLKIESYLAQDKQADAKKVYQQYADMQAEFDSNEILDYDTGLYQYESDLYERIK